jgi:hypothetical protein
VDFVVPKFHPILSVVFFIDSGDGKDLFVSLGSEFDGEAEGWVLSFEELLAHCYIAI